MNRIIRLFEQKPRGILNIYFTAGYPKLGDTREIILELARAGVDMIEIGMPFSDPIADGGTIQASNQRALENGISLPTIFSQLEGIREEVDIPLILMGYLNPVMQYGLEEFVKKAGEIGIDGLILPDLPMYEYRQSYVDLFKVHQLSNIFLITPQTSEARIQEIDQVSEGFIYVVSTDSTTGRSGSFGEAQVNYFKRIQGMQLNNPTLIGFGIHDQSTFEMANKYANGAIIGSAFIKAISNGAKPSQAIPHFVRQLR
ncbi:MAG: tryptophan synthase subunit alpha [Bacteroidota bacterium]